MTYELKGETTRKGDKAEISVIYKLMMKDIIVSQPMTENSPYDLLIDINGNILKIQIKTGVLGDGVINSNLQKTTFIKGQYIHSCYKKEDVDYFAIHCIENDYTALIPHRENISGIALRLELPRNNQRKGINLFDDYEIGKVISEIKNNRSISKSNDEKIEQNTHKKDIKNRIGKSGYRGVKKASKSSGYEWESYITIEGKNIYVGRSNDAEELAIKYDEIAIERLGEDAVTNKSLGLL